MEDTSTGGDKVRSRQWKGMEEGQTNLLQPKRPIPKFGSFKPPTTSTKTTQPAETVEKEDKKKSHDRHHRHHRDRDSEGGKHDEDSKHRRRHDSDRKHRHRSQSPDRKRRRRSESPTRLLEQDLSRQPENTEPLFVLDYGPKPEIQDIIRKEPVDEEKAKREKKEQEYRATKERKKEWERERRRKENWKKRQEELKDARLGVGLKVNKHETVTKIIANKTTSTAAETNADFISFDDSEPEPEETIDTGDNEGNDVQIIVPGPSESESDDEKQNEYFAFRDLRDKKKGPEKPKPIKDAWSDEKAREKNAELDKKAKSDPYNPEAWLEFVDHQDILLHAGRQGRRITQAERNSSGEVKLAILEKALKNLPHDEKLIARYMEIGATLWESVFYRQSCTDPMLTRFQAKGSAPKMGIPFEGQYSHVFPLGLLP